MATLLSTSKMNPALKARVERAVGGQHQGTARVVRRIVSIARVVLVLTIGFAIYSVVQGRRQHQRELSRSRSALLEAVSVKGATVSIEDRAIVTRAESWIFPLAGAYEGDLVADELHAPGAFASMLASRSSLYLRAPIDAVKSGPRIAEAASTSTKDSLLLCLLEPPPSRTEKVLIDKVHVAYLGGAAMEQRTANVHRLNDAIVGLPILLPEWESRVREAPDATVLARLRAELDRAPIARTKEAASSRLLLVAVDEPGVGTGPTELDGERPHAIRVVLADLDKSKLLLRLRLPVDPSWISASRRPTHASGLDACAFAFDVHARVLAAK